MILDDYLKKQQTWFLETFGPGNRDDGLIAHIDDEFQEIRDSPGDIEEWIDIVILGFEGALRNAKGNDLERVLAVVDCLRMNQEKNIARVWPDWKTADLEKPIMHIQGNGDNR